jgi:hypothetical protein
VIIIHQVVDDSAACFVQLEQTNRPCDASLDQPARADFSAGKTALNEPTCPFRDAYLSGHLALLNKETGK